MTSSLIQLISITALMNNFYWKVKWEIELHASKMKQVLLMPISDLKLGTEGKTRLPKRLLA
jgi:hypothetical protein